MRTKLTYKELRQRILNCDGASYWVKNQIQALETHDICDALRDIDTLKLLFDLHLNELCSEAREQIRH